MRTSSRLAARFGILLLPVLSVSEATAQSKVDSRSGRTIVVSEVGRDLARNTLLIDLIRSRLPLRVDNGRFNTADGITEVCVSSRRIGGRTSATLPGADPRLPVCDLIVVILNGERLVNAGNYLFSVRASDFESIELLSATDAMTRHGLSASGGEALELWSAGRGPYARSRTPSMD